MVLSASSSPKWMFARQLGQVTRSMAQPPCRSLKIMGAIKPILIYRFGGWQQEFEHWPLIFAFRAQEYKSEASRKRARNANYMSHPSQSSCSFRVRIPIEVPRMAIAFSFGLYPDHDLTALEGFSKSVKIRGIGGIVVDIHDVGSASVVLCRRDRKRRAPAVLDPLDDVIKNRRQENAE